MSNLKRNVNTSAYSKNTVISYRRLRVVLPPTDISYSVRVRTVTDPSKRLLVNITTGLQATGDDATLNNQSKIG